jgi:hypothetical protein
MNKRSLLSGMAIGAALAFALDPARGARRRAMVGDLVVRATRITGGAIDAMVREMSSRARSAAALIRPEPVDEATVLAQLRTRLGRVCSHPRAIDLDMERGEVTLRGPVLGDEVAPVLKAAAGVAGVRAVINELETYESSEGVSALQGRGQVARSRVPLRAAGRPMAGRAAVGVAALAAGGLAMAYARR